MKYGINLLLMLAALYWSSLVAAESVLVIVNVDNKQSLSVDEIKGIYSDNIIQWKNGESIKVYDLPIKEDAREVFSQKVLGTSASAAAQTWANRKITNSAKNPPKTKQEKLVLSLIKKDKNAIGYVSASAIEGKDGIKVLLTLK